MTKTSNTKKAGKKKPTKKDAQRDSITVNRRKEWRLDLPLPALVQGKLSRGKEFEEMTIIQNISSGGAYFCLDSGVTVGSRLNIVIDVPSELSPDKKIKLQLGGLTVRLEKPTEKGKKQGVALRFHKKYHFIFNDDIDQS
jgi:c-di-GMP-binding flagellar brake protein YcgR